MSYKHGLISRLKRAFTLAEVLITLTVIGVVAAMSIPNLIANIDDSKFTGARERAVYNIREATRSISSNNGGLNGLGTSIQFRNVLATYLATSKLCDTTTGCWHTANNSTKDASGNVLVTVPINGAGVGWGQVGNPGAAAGMILNNGTTMSVLYNTNCNENTYVYSATNDRGENHVCANIIFDTNGFAPPNKTGKDIGFATVINPVNTVVAGIAPDTANLADANWSTAQSNCSAKGDTWHLPTKDELNSLYFNKTITGLADAGYWSSTEYSPFPTYAWGHYTGSGSQGSGGKGNAFRVRCVRR